MPANLPAEARAKWVKVMEARTPEEKIRALEEFLSSVPKHKGTENLRLWARRRLAELRAELELRRRKRVGRGASLFIEKEGAGQAVLIGLPNSGKSLLVKRLTGARVVVADYPMSTQRPVPGMLRYEDILFQLVDTPPLMPGGGAWNTRVAGLARNADALIIVLDATRSPAKDYEWIRSFLAEEGVLLHRPKGRVVIEKQRGGKTGVRVTVMGRLRGCTADDIRRLLESYRIYSAHVKVYGEVSLEDVEQAIFSLTVYKPSIILVNKIDAEPRYREKIEELLEKTGRETPIIPVSAKTGQGLEEIGKALFKALEIIRVYTKEPNGPRSEKPLVLKKGATVYDAAKAIHKSFIETFRYAKIWGPSAKYPGERVGLDHVLEDGDTLEIHTKA